MSAWWPMVFGYLVDALCPPNPVQIFSALLLALRKKSAVFEEVVFWHHTPTTQSFLVHIHLLQEKVAALLGGARECTFIKLDKCPSVSRDPPDVLVEALRSMKSAMADSSDALTLSFSELFTGELLIPLAAMVIDYPVAYFPAFPAQTSFLEGQALDVYAVTFKWTIQIPDSTLGIGGECVVLTFSCPQVLASNHVELLPSTLIKQLELKFAAKLECLGASVFVTRRTECLERIAL